MTYMQTLPEELVKIQPRGLITIPKNYRQSLELQENTIARLKADRGRLIIEPVRTLPYPVRSYTASELRQFMCLDKKQARELKNANQK